MVPEDIKINLRSVLLTRSGGVPINEVIRDYKSLVCSHLDVRGLGFNDLPHLLKSIPDVARVAVDPQTRKVMVYPVDNQEALAYVNPTARKALRKSDAASSHALTGGTGASASAGTGQASRNDADSLDGSFCIFVGNLPSTSVMPEEVLKNELYRILSSFTVLNLRVKECEKGSSSAIWRHGQGIPICPESRPPRGSVQTMPITEIAFFETNPAHARDILSLHKTVQIGKKTIIFDESRGPIRDSGRSSRPAAENTPRRIQPLMSQPESNNARRPPLLPTPTPDSNGTQAAASVEADGEFTVELTGFPHNTEQKQLQNMFNMNRLKFKTVQVLQNRPPDSTKAIVSFSTFEDASIFSQLTLYMEGHKLSSKLLLGKDLMSVSFNGVTREVKVSEKPTSVSWLGPSPRAAVQQSISDVHQCANPPLENISSSNRASQRPAIQQSASNLFCQSVQRNVEPENATSEKASSVSLREPAPRLTVQQSNSDVRQLTAANNERESPGQSREQHNSAFQSGQFTTNQSQSRDRGGYNLNSCGSSRMAYNGINQVGHNSNEQTFGAFNQNFDRSSSNQYSKFGNNSNASGVSDKFRQSDKFTNQQGGRSAFNHSSYQGGSSSREQTSGQDLGKKIELKTSSHGLTAEKLHSVEQPIPNGNHTIQQLSPSVKQLFDIAKTGQVEQQQSVVEESPSHAESNPIDLSDLPPLEPDEYIQFMDELYLSGQFATEAALSPLPPPESTVSPLIKSPVNLMDSRPVVDTIKPSHENRQLIISPSPAACVISRSPDCTTQSSVQVLAVPAELSKTRIESMLRDCCIHAGLVSCEELSNPVDLLVVYIDPSNPRFFWAVIAAEPYLSETSELVNSLKELPESMPPFNASVDKRRRASVIYGGERTRVWIENISEQCASVMFVDYGNTDTVPLSDLQVLPDIYWRVRPLAVPFRLLPSQSAAKADHVQYLTEEHLNMNFTAKLRCPQQAGLEFVIDIESLVLNLELCS